MNDKLSIVLASWNDLELLQRCIYNLEIKANGFRHEVITVADPPYEKTKEWLGKKLDIKAIYGDKPRGHNYAIERGLEVATGDYIMWMDTDIVVSNNWWPKIKKILEADEKIGIIGPLSYPRWDQYIMTLHSVPTHLLREDKIDSNEMLKFVESREPEWFELGEGLPGEQWCKKYYGWPKGALLHWDYVFEGFIIMRRRVYEEIGAYTRNPSGGQEVNISRNARKKGWKIVCANRVHYWHCDKYPVCLGSGKASRARGGRYEEV